MDIVRFQSVTKVFGHRPGLANLLGRERHGETVALKELDLNVKDGEILALLGPNGSGKTTLLKLVSTMLLPDKGRVVVGESDTLQDAGAVRRSVGIAVANERSFYPRLTATENLDFFGTLENIPRDLRRRRIEELLGLMGLSDSADTLVMKFSTGMYQRLGLARAMLKDPRVLLLDEPTRSLDPEATAHLWQTMKETAQRGITLLVASHDFEEAALADRFCILERGVLREVGESRGTIERVRDRYFANTTSVRTVTT